MNYKAQIGVIDDDKAVRDALGNLLAALGYVTRKFQSADDFIEDGDTTSLSCLITDVQMPGMTGIELIEHLSQSGRGIPVIVVAAHSHLSLRARAQRNGAIAWLEKPIRQELLVEAIERAISRRRILGGDRAALAKE